MTVQLVDFMGGDHRVVQAAKVSTQGSDALGADGTEGFINYLARSRHGSPFEHSTFTFLLELPIFVVRELQRHRIASFNEESGRYKQLAPVFYVPDRDRKLVQVGKPGEYRFEQGRYSDFELTANTIEDSSRHAYKEYDFLLRAGIAREVARMVLPLNIYSSLFITLNARSLMNLLSLRVQDDTSMFPSFPQREIEMMAEQMEEHFKTKMPATYKAFIKHGRVAP